MPTKRKVNTKAKVEVKPPSRHSKNVLEINVTNNGYQYTTVGLTTVGQVFTLMFELTDWLVEHGYANLEPPPRSEKPEWGDPMEDYM